MDLVDTFLVVKRKDEAVPRGCRTEEMMLPVYDERQTPERARPGEAVAGGWTP